MGETDINEIIPTIVGVVTVLIGVFTLFKGFQEYKKHNMLTRIEIYLQMRDKYARQEEVQRVCAALGNGKDTPVSELTYYDKRLFLGTMETVALMVNSDVINKHVALYMFGFFAIEAWDADDFWDEGLNKDDDLWSLFKDFVIQMKVLKKEFKNDTSIVIKNNLNFHPYAFKEYN